MTAPTPWKIIAKNGEDVGPFIVDADHNLIDVRRDGNAKLIVNAVNVMTGASTRENAGDA